MLDSIEIKGAREHNLKNISLSIPRNKLVVFTGVSGCGKSSLAFDTIFAEGQRRYVESLSSYARMFLGQMDKPDVDYVGGLSPAISIDQKTTSNNPRSTVGTVTEIYDYLRILWASVGTPHCPKCGRVISRQSIDEIVDQLYATLPDERVMILAPVVRGKKGSHEKVISDAVKSGYTRIVADGNTYDLSETIELDKNVKHFIDIVVDRAVIKESSIRRITESVETASALTGGIVRVTAAQSGESYMFSRNYACPECGISFEEISPRFFSFNNPYGACPTCGGLGYTLQLSPDLLVPDKSKSLNDGAIIASGWSKVKVNSIAHMYYSALAKKYGFTLDTPIEEFSDIALNALLYGTGDEKLELHYEKYDGAGTIFREYEGLIPGIQRRYTESKSASSQKEIESLMIECLCPECKGKRLKKEALSVYINDIDIMQFSSLSVIEAKNSIINFSLTEKQRLIAANLISEIYSRLTFLESVGMGYISLSRSANTLSGGENQRIRLATQIGSGLMGVLYVLDEPSIGLHPSDNSKLIKTLKALRDRGNSVLVVEHDEETILASDYVLEIGPGAGDNGGKLVFAGTPEEMLRADSSLTGDYLSGRKYIAYSKNRRKPSGKSINVIHASQNNLKDIDVSFPIGLFITVTGVSGSGKSSLVNEILYKYLSREKNHSKLIPGKCSRITGTEFVDKVIAVDQSPIGKTPRSNPATYTGVFTDIRELFSSVKDARIRGFGPDRFSFNVKGGRCEACTGEGYQKIEMHFLPDVFVPCDVCNGTRFNRETLEIKYKGKNISDILDMTIDQAISFFENQPKILKKLQAMADVGIGYIKLGQPSNTLSGGEAQRVKLSTELLKTSTGNTVYILDEPTTGLHPDDVSRLITVLNRLVDAGNTVIVIEHNLNVVKVSDYIIDLGPEGGDGGGNLVFAGTPENCCLCEESITGKYLNKYLS